MEPVQINLDTMGMLRAHSQVVPVADFDRLMINRLDSCDEPDVKWSFPIPASYTLESDSKWLLCINSRDLSTERQYELLAAIGKNDEFLTYHARNTSVRVRNHADDIMSFEWVGHHSAILVKPLS